MPPVDTDPHFIIHVPQKEDTLCFNINEEPGVILNLVQDPNTGIVTTCPPPDRAGSGLPCPSTLGHGQDDGWGLHFLHPVHPSVTWLASTCLFLTLSTYLGPVQGCFTGR